MATIRKLRSGLVSLSFFLALMLPAASLLAQEILPRVSVATRADGLGYVVRMHFESAPDSFKVFQPTADRIQLAVYKNGLDVSRTDLPAPGEVVSNYNITPFRYGAGLDIKLAEGQYFIANAYPDANQRHLLIGLTRASQRDISILTDGMRTIDWASLYQYREDSGDTLATSDSEELSDSLAALIGEIPIEDREDGLIDAIFPEPIQYNSNYNGKRLRTIIIDPGHGGRDPGAIGPGRTREKDVALAVAKKLGEYINQYLPDVNVVYTRTDDTFIDLHERGRIANRAQGDLFISIHANASTNRAAHGTEVFFLGVARTQSALEVMKRENSVIALEDPATRTRELTEEELILYELTNVGYMATSQRIAEKMDYQFSQRAGRRSRGVKQGGLIVLFQASMPAVLVEIGFISNAQEERYMNSEQGQAILASAMFRAIRDYKVAIESNIASEKGE